jgi:alanine racemase
MNKGRPTWVDIDLGALRHNLEQIQGRIGPERQVIGVVKANAYGHGAVAVGRHLLDAGVHQLAVATVAEGLELRDAGLCAPILVFAGRYGDQASTLWQANLEPVVFTDDVLDTLAAHRPPGSHPLRVHLQIDSGMGRLGCSPARYEHLLSRVEDSPAFELAGLMTHLACADLSSRQDTDEQLRIFTSLTDAQAARGVRRHAANSAAIAAHPAAWFDAVRPGLALYGVEPISRICAILVRQCITGSKPNGRSAIGSTP